MRGLLALVLLVPLLGGCLGGAPDPGPPAPALNLGDIQVPDGARLVATATGAALEWTDVAFTFRETVKIPAGVTLVRAEAELVGAEGSVRAYLFNAETERRRCNIDSAATAWNVLHTVRHQCSGLAAIDPPGTEWVIQVTGPSEQVENRVRLVLEATALDGVASLLDLGRLSMPTHRPQPTRGEYVPSFDGTPIWVEVTLPDGEGPWPTIIASSPYNGQYDRLVQGGPPAMWGYWTHDWVKRGYAAVNADVRGFGLSGGCVEVWGENEQRDQAFLVDWVAQQAWSDKRVGFYGQSYVGTTPVAAAVQAPDALKAIIAVAPVNNAYEDWHYGGVPNGENTLSPVAYQVLTDVPPTPDQDPDAYLDPLTLAENIGKGLCDPTLVARANDPRALYTDFYEERDFKLRADQVRAAVLFTQGFEDANVKSAMIPGWFNGIEAPKLGIFGHWVHQHPTRADAEILFLGWMDEHVKGKDLGFSRLPNVLVRTNTDHERHAASWPDPLLERASFYADWASGMLQETEPPTSSAELPLGPAALTSETLRVRHTATEDVRLAGVAELAIRGTLEPGGNAFLAARLYDSHGGRMDLVTYGMVNLAHDEAHRTWTPVTGPVATTLRFLPTEYVFRAGHDIVIEFYGVWDNPLAFPGLNAPVGRFHAAPGAFSFGAPNAAEYNPIPATAQH
jgi:predicted acyl esterase